MNKIYFELLKFGSSFQLVIDARSFIMSDFLQQCPQLIATIITFLFL